MQSSVIVLDAEVLFNDLKRGKEQLRKAMKAFRKRQKAEDSA